MATPPSKPTLQTRYPLPDWTVDSLFKRALALAVADAIGHELDRWPDRPLKAHTERVTRAAQDALKPHLTWLDDTGADGCGYPGDVLVSYIAQLALTRPDETLTADQYRGLLHDYRRHLETEARRFDA